MAFQPGYFLDKMSIIWQALENSVHSRLHVFIMYSKTLALTRKNVHANFEIPLISKFLKDILQKCFITASLKFLLQFICGFVETQGVYVYFCYCSVMFCVALQYERLV